MEFSISDQAVKWYQTEMGITQETGIRFLGKVYGETPVHEGFSLGVEVASPINPLRMIEKDGTRFFIEKNDEWFFTGLRFEVGYDEVLKEPTYHYTRIEA